MADTTLLFSLLRRSYDSRKWDIIAALALFSTFLICYSDILFVPAMIGGLDFQIPVSNPWNYFQFGMWTEMNLGFVDSDFFFYNKVFTGLINFISAGNQIIAQKLFFSGIFFSGVGCYVLLRNHVIKSKSIATVSAMIYMFAPFTIQNYGTGLIWELAFIPLAINFGLNFLLGKNQIRNILLFCVLYSLSIGFGIHALLGIPITLFVIFLTRLFMTEGTGPKWLYVKRMFFITVLGTAVFVIMNPGVMNVVYTYFGLNTSDVSGSHVIPKITANDIFQNYASSGVEKILTMSHWLKVSYLAIGGVILLSLALAGSFLRIRMKSNDNFIMYSFLAVFSVFALYGLMLYFKSPLFSLLYAIFPFLAILRGTEGIAPYIILSIAVLLSLSMTTFLKYIDRSKLSINLRNVTSITMMISILAINFAYSPAFSPQQHLQAQHYTIDRTSPVTFPTVYDEIISWLRGQPDHTMYRAVLLPTSFLSAIYLPYEYQYLLSPTNGYEDSNSFVQSVQESLLKGTTTWGSEIAPASVKFIIVPHVSDEPKQTEATVRGNPHIWYGLGFMMNGDPKAFVSLLENQKEIKLIYNSSSFAVYENLAAMPRITTFREPIALVTTDITFSEWATVASESNAIPLTFSSINDVPTELRDYAYNPATNTAFDEIDLIRRQLEDNSPYFYRIVQSGSDLLVYVPNYKNEAVDYLFNIVVNGQNRLTYTDTVAANSLSILRFDYPKINAEDNAAVFIADSVHNQVSNIIIWQTNTMSTSNISSEEAARDLLANRIFVTSEGERITAQSDAFAPIQSIEQISPSNYNLHINSSEPFYLFLGESYSDNWRMFADSKELSHYKPLFGNIFYVSETGDFTVSLEYDNPLRHTLILGITFWLISLIFAVSYGYIAQFARTWVMHYPKVVLAASKLFFFIDKNRLADKEAGLHGK